MSEEVRVTNEKTGGEKGQKLARFDLIPQHPLWLLAELYGTGAKKYAERNWERGYDWSLSYEAMQRHLSLFWQGEDCDPETGVPHVINAVFHCFALAEFMRTHPELDNRPKMAPEPEQSGLREERRYDLEIDDIPHTVVCYSDGSRVCLDCDFGEPNRAS